MPRPKIIRMIGRMPSVGGLKPFGMSCTDKDTEDVFMLYEEYESIRLCDYEDLNQNEAASLMNISRPTLTRIYNSARKKIALSMIEGRRILIEGGKIEINAKCANCGNVYNERKMHCRHRCKRCYKLNNTDENTDDK
ncbi:MAG: DUF134 domain-containing protein [Bacteroidales bacterium]|jgi:predicted DNA-binding protein (UPF0251 family)|nr:DUF134 domain-containing protein [Bacteroidales bacterium]MCI1784827.1 DUF134 domain-containing protein [Bacteroidales bacterium]